ncbi:MAG TPA: TetR/AcrR family transcriptional regulator [Methylomirabilota bacterium]|nr:TetR/AcrR family transcriptional regulator [Methylomirabilota bacterium]
MTIEARYEDILTAACDVIARRGFPQASTREIARTAGLSPAGLYHYVGGKEEILFLVLDRSLDRLLAQLEAALARARAPETKILALVQTHLDFGLHQPAALKIINRDYELLSEPRRSEITAKRQAYLGRGLQVLRHLDPHGRSGDELLSATNLLLGMLNGIATRPFLRPGRDVRALAAEVAALFLYGFLERSADRGGAPAAFPGGKHDA